jgi:hypothetical protein
MTSCESVINNFLEPMAKFAGHKVNKEQLDEFVWRPYTENIPFRWPIPPFPLWVESKSIFRGGTMEIHEFTRAELGQLFDLRPEWAENISQYFCTWNDVSPPPIRLLAEVGITGALWIKQADSVKRVKVVSRSYQVVVHTWGGRV